MSKPQISDLVGGYKFIWQEDAIDIAVSRLKSNSDGTLKGEIVIGTSLPGYSPHLHQAQFNFSSTQTRDGLIKSLTKQCPEADWTSIIEQLRVYTLERERRGQPVKTLFASGEIKQPEYYLFPLIIKNLPNCIFGDPGSLKSNTALIFTQLIQLPWRDNPMNFQVPVNPAHCLYLDWETDEDTLQWQLTKIQNGYGEDKGMSIEYRRCSIPLANDVEQIQKHITDTGANLIIIDSLGMATGGELKEAEPALRFFSALRQINVTALVLAHTAKAQGEVSNNKKSIFGSVFFEAGMRNIWEIRKQQENDEDEAHIALFHKKAPPFGKLQKPIGFKLEFTDTSLTAYPEDPKNISEFIERMGTQQRILEALKAGAMTAADLQSVLTDLTETNIRYTLSELKKKNRIITTERGKYGLLSRYEE